MTKVQTRFFLPVVQQHAEASNGATDSDRRGKKQNIAGAEHMFSLKKKKTGMHTNKKRVTSADANP